MMSCRKGIENGRRTEGARGETMGKGETNSIRYSSLSTQI